MIKTFCDKCGVQLPPLSGDGNFWAERGMPKAETKLEKGEVLAVYIGWRLNGSDYAGDFCFHCLLGLVNTIDKRPRSAT